MGQFFINTGKKSFTQFKMSFLLGPQHNFSLLASIIQEADLRRVSHLLKFCLICDRDRFLKKSHRKRLFSTNQIAGNSKVVSLLNEIRSFHQKKTQSLRQEFNRLGIHL